RTDTGKGRALHRAGECAAIGVTGASANGDGGERRDERLVLRAVFRRLLLISMHLTNKKQHQKKRPQKTKQQKEKTKKLKDSQTGAYHELPDHLSGYGGYGDQVVYDGLGNPVGRLAGLFDDIGSAIRGVVSNIPVVGPMLSNILPGGGAGPPVPPVPPGFPP